MFRYLYISNDKDIENYWNPLFIRLSSNYLTDKFNYLKLVYSHALTELKWKKYMISILKKKIANDEIVSDRNKRMHEWKIQFSRSRKWSKWFPLSPTADPNPSYPAIPSFRSHISPFHPSAPIEFDATVDVIREIHFSYEVVFPVVIVGRVVVDSWRFVSYGWQQMELRRKGASFHGSRASRIFPPRPITPSSLFFVAALYENEKVTSYQRDRASPSSFPLLATGMLPSLQGLFLVCSTTMSSPALSPAASMHSRDSLWRGDTGANMI